MIRTAIATQPIKGVEVTFSRGEHYYYAQYSRNQNTHTIATLDTGDEAGAIAYLRCQVEIWLQRIYGI